MDVKIVRCRIPDILEKKKRSQVWLADEVGISPQYLNDLIRLRSIMGIVMGARIARVLKVNIDDLYVWEWLGE